MKRLMWFLILICWIPGFGLISPDLARVVSSTKPEGLIGVDIVFKEQMDIQELKNAVHGLPRREKRVRVAEILQAFSAPQQRAVLEYLRQMEKQGRVADIRSFWINNAIYCRVTADVINFLDTRDDIKYIDHDLKPIELEKPSYAVPSDVTREVDWGVRKIRADLVWSLGYTGQGVVVGMIDTGVNYNHLDLIDHMWTDPNYPNHGWNFELNNNNPMDEQGHGTHTAGTVASDGSAGSQCGVAPDAQIMALRVRTQVDTVAENQVWAAMEFVISPPLSPANGGDLISMSLGWQYAWSPRRATWRTSCDNVGAAGIVMIVAAGNERGTNYPPEALRCPGDVPPPWRNPENGAMGALSDVVTIGATDSLDNIASFSSPGPVTWQSIAPFNDYTYPPGLTTPDVSAPGVDIKSCSYTNTSGYAFMSGTSMATPHTAGVVALMLSRKPDLTPEAIDSILEWTAVDLGPAGKDNDFGAGRIDAFNAITAVQINAHNVAALDFTAPAARIEEFITVQPQVRVINSGIYDETNIPVQCMIHLGGSCVYTSSRVISSLTQGSIETVTFDDFNISSCGSHYQASAFTSLPGDTIFYDDSTELAFVAGRLIEIVDPGCNAWKYPNADSGSVPLPSSLNWNMATMSELQQIAVLDSQWWVTAGATDSAHQDLQLYGFLLSVPDTAIEQLNIEWWGHHGGPPHERCALYFWNDQTSTWSMRVSQLSVTDDVTLSSALTSDSAAAFIAQDGYLYVASGADVYVKSCCPLLFADNGQENVFIGDIMTGGDIGTWLDRFCGVNMYLPPDHDEYVKIDGKDLKIVDGRYRLTINEMLQEVTYLDEVELYVVDHPADYDIYPHEALRWPGYHGLTIHTSDAQPLAAAYDSEGRDILATLLACDRVYVPFARSEITGFAEPFTITLDVGELAQPDKAVLYLSGSARFPDAAGIGTVSDIYQARELKMKVQAPRVEVLDARGHWREVSTCGVPAGHEKVVTYPLYDEKGHSIFRNRDRRLRLSFSQEVYLDKAWVSCLDASDYGMVLLAPDSADLHYYGYAAYISRDGKYPGTFDYEKRVTQDYAKIAGYYTRYGNVQELLEEADNRFVIMSHGDEVSLEFDAQALPQLRAGWRRSFVLAAKGFYKMARPGRAYAYSVDPLPYYGMRQDLAADGIGYYPYDPSPGLFGSLVGRVYARVVWGYPFSLGDAWAMIKYHFAGHVDRIYPAHLTEYCQAWNTRMQGTYFPEDYTDLPPHANLEQVPMDEHAGEWPAHLASLGIPFGAHSLHSNYIRVWLVTTQPIGVEELADQPASVVFRVGHPNPFRQHTNISYALRRPSQVELGVYDISGRFVRCLVQGMLEPGEYQSSWDGRDDSGKRLAAGVYFVRFKTADSEKVEKAVLIR
jgi:subtilisin family serine protease